MYGDQTVLKDFFVDGTIGSRLLELRKRSGLTLEQVSSLAGYRGRSSVQQFFRSDYDPGILDSRVATRLADAMVGKGAPPIDESEIYALAGGIKPYDAPETHVEDPAIGIRIPVFSAKRAKKFILSDDPDGKLDAMTYETSNPLSYVHLPSAKDPFTRAYGLYLGTATLSPRYDMGELVIVEERRQAMLFDDVIIQVADAQRDDKFFTHALAGKIAEFGSDSIFLRFLTPERTVEIPYDRIVQIERIMTVGDVLSG